MKLELTIERNGEENLPLSSKNRQQSRDNWYWLLMSSQQWEKSFAWTENKIRAWSFSCSQIFVLATFFSVASQVLLQRAIVHQLHQQLQTKLQIHSESS